MLGITFGAHKEVGCSLFKTGTAFAANFTVRGFISHLASSLLLIILPNNHYRLWWQDFSAKNFVNFMIASGAKVNMKDEMLTLTAAADFLQISTEVLRRHAKNGVIPAHKEGRTWRFFQRELEAWLHSGGPQVAADVDDSPWGK
jgi:excisionase family DNA binding protein